MPRFVLSIGFFLLSVLDCGVFAYAQPTRRWVSPGVWRLDRADHHCFLMGTCHIAGLKALPSNVVVWLSLVGSLAFEANIEAMLDASENQGLLPEGQTLKDVLSPESHADLIRFLAHYGIEYQHVEQATPLALRALTGMILA